MVETKNFLDELLEETEAKENKLLLAHVDLILSEISRLETEIADNFEQTDQEKAILDSWVLQRNSKLSEKITWMKRKLEAFMNEQGENVKTIDLPNGKLLRRKQPNRVEIVDMDKFMSNDNLYQLGTVHPQQIEPNLNMIKAYINTTKRLPMGVRVVEGTEKFSIKLKNNKEEDNGTTS